MVRNGIAVYKRLNFNEMKSYCVTSANCTQNFDIYQPTGSVIILDARLPIGQQWVKIRYTINTRLSFKVPLSIAASLYDLDLK